ncbi:hypothetical protein AB0I72_07895 [Nocardiopsis sp. NPDC049922]|uniref:hypothetical protein n=1 Tax=Nocardiopsis sp. NPDC049922 TaxID=3155157 RepID=UPI0033CA02AC
MRLTRILSGGADRHLTWHWAFALIGAFMVLFGVLNFAELPLGWKDRTDQIGGYLDATVGLGPEWVPATLWGMKSIELLLGLVALVAVARRDPRFLVAAILGWMVVMTGMAGMDIWANDRAELQEHTVYFAAFAQLLIVVVALGLVRPARHLLARLDRTVEEPRVRVPEQREVTPRS